MSWKNLAQNSLADSLLVSHECIKELDEFLLLFREAASGDQMFFAGMRIDLN